ncbi:hypothetical protein CPLU01_08423 [Colletotrichum plurivorum]|uniref:Uncharacterized protein n=1 Tax=Colletotrichum plurivorum TaxID=2175906 RepID=A0A8H6KBT0_9PEZI|nr:hypothetical protein CPLU01_08423 [Colletotrichum plurivorum]
MGGRKMVGIGEHEDDLDGKPRRTGHQRSEIEIGTFDDVLRGALISGTRQGEHQNYYSMPLIQCSLVWISRRLGGVTPPSLQLVFVFHSGANGRHRPGPLAGPWRRQPLELRLDAAKSPGCGPRRGKMGPASLRDDAKARLETSTGTRAHTAVKVLVTRQHATDALEWPV